MQITTARLSQILFETDPMQTACMENDCFDEYDSIAESAVELMKKGMAFNTALHQVIAEMFYEQMADDIDYNAIENLLKR